MPRGGREGRGEKDGTRWRRRKLVYCECINGGGVGGGPMRDASVPSRLKRGRTMPEINDGPPKRGRGSTCPDEMEMALTAR